MYKITNIFLYIEFVIGRNQNLINSIQHLLEISLVQYIIYSLCNMHVCIFICQFLCQFFNGPLIFFSIEMINASIQLLFSFAVHDHLGLSSRISSHHVVLSLNWISIYYFITVISGLRVSFRGWLYETAKRQ